jgi:hypothetical protein
MQWWSSCVDVVVIVVNKMTPMWTDFSSKNQRILYPYRV